MSVLLKPHSFVVNEFRIHADRHYMVSNSTLILSTKDD